MVNPNRNEPVYSKGNNLFLISNQTDVTSSNGCERGLIPPTVFILLVSLSGFFCRSICNTFVFLFAIHTFVFSICNTFVFSICNTFVSSICYSCLLFFFFFLFATHLFCTFVRIYY